MYQTKSFSTHQQTPTVGAVVFYAESYFKLSEAIGCGGDVKDAGQSKLRSWVRLPVQFSESYWLNENAQS